MKKVIFIFLLFSIGCEERKLIVPQNPCPEVQNAVDNYKGGDILIRSGCEVLFSSDFSVRNGIMEVEEGAVLYFKDGGLIIERDAELLVMGSAQKPAIFTSRFLYPLMGDWKGIIIKGKGSIEGGIVEYGDDGISLSGDLTMIDSEVRRNLYYGLRMVDINALIDINRSKFYENGDDMFLFSDALTLLSPGLDLEGFIVVDGSDGVIYSGDWQAYDYLFTSDIEILNKARISVKSDAKIYVETGPGLLPYGIKVKDEASIFIKGATFQSSDINYCWGGIVFDETANPSFIENSEIYDGGDGYYEANIGVFSDLRIENSEIADSCADGIYIGDGGVLSMTDSFIENNYRYGVYVDCGGFFENINNSFSGNSEGDIAYPTWCP